MEIKLKPCPFCGRENESEAAIHKWHFPYDTYTVVCDSCGAMIHNNFTSEEAAAEAWNTRAEHKGHWNMKNGLYECSECGAWFPHLSDYCRDCGAKMDKRDEERTGHWIKIKEGYYVCSECGSCFPSWETCCRKCGTKMASYADCDFSDLATDEDLPF